MKLILTQAVDGLGGVGDLVEVRDGYGRNFLVPQGLAIRAHQGAAKQVALLRRDRAVRAERALTDAKNTAATLADLTVTLSARSGGASKLFGSVTPSDVADAIMAAGGPMLDKRTVTLDAPIRTLGRHQVTVRLHPEVDAAVSLDVVPVAKKA